MPPAIELTAVRKDYYGLRPLRVRELVVSEGEIVALSGLDAAAAEVLTNLVTGATLPDEGLVRVFGEDTAAIANADAWLTGLDPPHRCIQCRFRFLSVGAGPRPGSPPHERRSGLHGRSGPAPGTRSGHGSARAPWSSRVVFEKGGQAPSGTEIDVVRNTATFDQLDREGDSMPKGTIKRLVRDRGFGFIRDDGGQEWFFHRSAVCDSSFDQLNEGERVSFEEEPSTKGPRAIDVRPEAA